jgi:hypothetical protein
LHEDLKKYASTLRNDDGGCATLTVAVGARKRSLSSVRPHVVDEMRLHRRAVLKHDKMVAKRGQQTAG